jgi:uncharacterized protein HemY
LLCLRQKLWGKAQRHLEQALSDAIEPRTVRESHLALAQLHEALDQQEERRPLQAMRAGHRHPLSLLQAAMTKAEAAQALPPFMPLTSAVMLA